VDADQHAQREMTAYDILFDVEQHGAHVGKDAGQTGGDAWPIWPGDRDDNV
jgi:hypothetical protein